jgi:hypothetical protein
MGHTKMKKTASAFQSNFWKGNRQVGSYKFSQGTPKKKQRILTGQGQGKPHGADKWVGLKIIR